MTYLSPELLHLTLEMLLRAKAEPMTAEQVREVAKARGRSMAEVCREADIAPTTFTRWASGTTEPTLDVYRRICKAALGEG